MQPSEFGLESTKSPLGKSTFSSLTIAQLRERAHPPTHSGAIVLPCLADGSVIGPDRLQSFHKRRGHLDQGVAARYPRQGSRYSCSRENRTRYSASLTLSCDYLPPRGFIFVTLEGA
jgi:hypothetical protein